MRLRTYVAQLLLLSMGAIAAFAQTTQVKGYVKGPDGPVVGAQVQLKDSETGRKFTLKSDKKGEFFSIGISPGKYDVTVTKDSKVIYTANGFPVSLNNEVNELDIDLQPTGGDQAAQAPAPAPGKAQAQPKLTEEQKKEMEETQKKNAEIAKENLKIGNLNNLLKEAQADMQAKNYDGAVTVMQQAEQADNGQHYQVLGVLGSAFVADKKYPEGIDALNKAIALAQNDPKGKPMMANFYDNLGQAYAKSGKIPEAVDAYNKEAEQDPAQAAGAYYNEGAVLTNTGKADDANAAFDKAIQADPNKADAYYQKGVNLLQKGTFDQKTNTTKYPPEAAEALNKYLELQPTGPHAEEAKALLDQMGEKTSSSFKAGKKK